MSWEKRMMAQFDAYVRQAEAEAARWKSRQSPQVTADEKDLRLAEKQRRLEEELRELERTSIIHKADLERQIEWHERQIEAVKRQRQENKGFATTLEY